MKILNFGSLNLDYVYTVDHFVRPGETLAVSGRSAKHGGKGLNQSIALARAGLAVSHAGCLGSGGESLRALLEENGVNTDLLHPVDEIQGHAVIQVDAKGENSILLYGGSNLCVTEEQVQSTLSLFGRGDYLVLQNEINLLPMIVDAAAGQEMQIMLNPSPITEALYQVDLSKVTWLIMNEAEAGQISGEKDPGKAWQVLHHLYPQMSVLITLGSCGSIAWRASNTGIETARQDAVSVQAVDTTGAGDTYTGYFIAGLAEGMPLQSCMGRASRAAAISVTRLGAAASIPRKEECEGIIAL